VICPWWCYFYLRYYSITNYTTSTINITIQNKSYLQIKKFCLTYNFYIYVKKKREKHIKHGYIFPCPLSCLFNDMKRLSVRCSELFREEAEEIKMADESDKEVSFSLSIFC